MTAALSHRGPDDAGKWLDPQAGIALGHRRLAILDLSRAGHQPMASPSGRFQVTYNGEIYNYLDLRRSLSAAGHTFRSGTDTEVLVTSLEQHGVAGTVERLVGQFAFAAWDSRERRLWLVRDRLGEKPLYHGVFPTPHGPLLLFGSELSALRAHPSFDEELDREALAAFLRFNYLPAPRTIHARVRKLAAGHRIVYGESDLLTAAPEAYWSADEHVRAPRLVLDDRAAMDRLQESRSGPSSPAASIRRCRSPCCAASSTGRSAPSRSVSRARSTTSPTWRARRRPSSAPSTPSSS
jgi:asparagine synthase (glutamine-hydrolysing)